MNNALQPFRDAMIARGIVPPDDLIADGRIHRCDVEGKRGKGDASYLLHPDGIPAGGFQNWRDGLGWQDWSAKPGRPLTPGEKAEQRAKIEAAQQERREEEARRHEEAQRICALAWNQATPVDSANPHPYLARKGVQSYGLRAAGNGKLLVPVRDVSGTLHSLQFIDADGIKRFKTGGRKRGGYFSIGKPNGTLCVVEGYATGASIHEATGYAVAVAFDAGNLPLVARALREKLPDVKIVICADDDHLTQDNPGLTKAREAARAVSGLVAVPVFGENRADGDSDFNDLYQAQGLEAVARCVEAASEPPGEKSRSGAGNAPAGELDSLTPPSPLPKLPGVPEFPLELLPDDLMDWVADAAERARFRPEFAAVPCMAALGSLIGRKLGIRLKRHDDWTEYANIWGAIAGPPSALKSPAMREAMRPFKVLQAEADARYRGELTDYETALEGCKLRKGAKKKTAAKALTKNPEAEIDLDCAEPDKPVARVYWTSDSTAERLGELLAENPNGLLVERDELSSFLVKLEDETQATARGLYLSGWSGKEGYRFDRIGRGVTNIPKFALSIVGGIQPGPLSRYVRGAYSGERADGLLQRFQLLVWPDAEDFRYVDRYPDNAAKGRVNALFSRADTFDPETIGQHDGFGDDPPFIRLSDEAQGLFVEWYSGFMQERREAESGEESSALATHFGKYPGLVGKLALILHVADDPDGREVSRRTLIKALAWAQYLTPHARRVYHAAEHPETGAAELLLARVRRGELPPSFSARDIYRKCWQGLSDRDGVKKACRLLFDYGWLIELREPGQTGGRPSDPVYAASPLMEGAS
jgi:putative DNA primase/helicase